MGGRDRLLVVLVRGPSMVPTLRDGDALLAVRGLAVRPGDLVVAELPGDGRLVVKRAVRPVTQGAGDAWWVEGDNPYGSDDSRAYGAVPVRARVVWRWWPLVRTVPAPMTQGASVVRSLLRRHATRRRREQP